MVCFSPSGFEVVLEPVLEDQLAEARGGVARLDGAPGREHRDAGLAPALDEDVLEILGLARRARLGEDDFVRRGVQLVEDARA